MSLPKRVTSTIYYLATLLLLPWLLTGCESQSVNTGTGNSSVAFQLPEQIRSSRAINQQQISAVIILGNREIPLTRNGDNFTGSINVTSGTMLSFVLQISEQSGSQSIVLATLNNTRLITDDTNITLRSNQYAYPDTDSDGFNNLSEREAGSDYANSNSTPDNPEGQNGGSDNELNPGVLQFSAESYAVAEADGSLEITVNRTGGSDGRVTVRYSLNSETAIRDQDFQTSTGELAWEDGDSTPRTITAIVLSDDDFEGDQTFTAHLFSASGGSAVGNGFVRINLRDSTAPPQRGTIKWTSNVIQVSEDSATVEITLERIEGKDGLVTVDYSTSDITATAGLDYSAVENPRTLAWADGDDAAKKITIQILNDDLIEPTETFSVNLSSVRGGATLGTPLITVSIIDSTIPEPQNGIASIPTGVYRVNEGASIEIPVERSNGNDGSVAVEYRLLAGTATVPADVAAVAGTLAWADNDSATQFITIAINEDTFIETPETISLLLENSTGGIEITTESIEITIIDTTIINAGSIAFTEVTGSVNEGESIEIPVVRSDGSDQAVSVNIEVESADSLEFSVNPTTVSWANGEAGIQTITVTANNDTVADGSQPVTLTLALSENSMGEPTLTNTIYTLTIIDDSPTGFIPLLATDGEWEVCVSPFQTVNATAFSTQISTETGTTVTCIKQCPLDALIDANYPAWGWNTTLQQSCLFTTASPGTVSKVPVYTPEREVFTLNLAVSTFAVPDSAWVCTNASRQNADFDYTPDTTNYRWYQILADGTYYFADSTNNTALPELLNGPETWSVAGRNLNLNHIGEVYRNIVVAPSAQSFEIHPDTDRRISCQLSAINVSIEDEQ